VLFDLSLLLFVRVLRELFEEGAKARVFGIPINEALDVIPAELHISL
jgi:hypothetical protein